MTLVNPSREFEDIYDRVGQLMNMAVGSLGPVAVPDLPWALAADVPETDDAYMVRVELPGVQRDQIDLQLQDRELVISGEIPGVAARRERAPPPQLASHRTLRVPDAPAR